ncbi:MAG: HD domain-containing protein [Candidatus Heimdallarchaeota archaeon]
MFSMKRRISPLLSFEPFFETITIKNSRRDQKTIQKAFEFAAEKHAGQKRKFTGEPYFVHPIAVAQLLRPFEDEVIIAGLLHDVVEDTNAAAEDISREFGSEVALLVQGCTKDPTKQRTPMAILEKVAKQDKRVIFVKLADRYDNLGDNILSMKHKTIRKYHNETPELLELAQTYSIDYLGESIQSRLDVIGEWLHKK